MPEVTQKQYEQLCKQATRQKTLALVRAGKIMKRPCVICGEMNVQAHHIDYGDAYTVSWVCRDHHVEYHDSIKYVYEFTPDYMLDVHARVLEYLRARPDFGSLEEVAVGCAVPSMDALYTIIARLVGRHYARFPTELEYTLFSGAGRLGE